MEVGATGDLTGDLERAKSKHVLRHAVDICLGPLRLGELVLVRVSQFRRGPPALTTLQTPPSQRTAPHPSAMGQHKY